MRNPSWKLIRGKDGKLVQDEKVWKNGDALTAKMPKEGHGIKQALLNMRTPPEGTYPGDATAKNWSEVVEAEPVKGGKPTATWGDKILGIETHKTGWFGTREGMNIHAISPRKSAHRAIEPCNPLPPKTPELYEAYQPYAEALGYAAEKAGGEYDVTLDPVYIFTLMFHSYRVPIRVQHSQYDTGGNAPVVLFEQRAVPPSPGNRRVFH